MKFRNAKKKAKNIKSPSNSRGITERYQFSLPKINHATLLKIYGKVLRVFVVFVFILAVIVVGLDFKNILQTKQEIDSQREVLNRDLKFWEDFISRKQDYRDAYFQASILAYKLGNVSKAKKYVERGLFLDPNSENGKKLEKFLVNK